MSVTVEYLSKLTEWGIKMKIQHFITKIYGKQIYINNIVILLLAATISVTQFFTAWYLGLIIDSVNLGLSPVIKNTIIITISVLINFISSLLLYILLQNMSYKLTNNLRKKAAEKICKSEYKSLAKFNDGNLLTISVSDTESISAWFNIIVSIGQIPIKIIIVFIAIIRIHWILFIICIILFPLTLLPSLFLSKKMYKLNLDEQKSVDLNTNFIKETLSFIIILKSFCLEHLFISKNKKILKDLEIAKLKKQKRDRLIQSFSRCIGYIANPILFTTAAYLILQGNMTIGQIISIMFFIDIAGEGINLLTGISNQYQAVKSYMTRIVSLLDVPNERTTGSALRPTIDAPVFDLSNVSFSYLQNKILKDVSLKINKGDKVAIIGRSGSGKTTLFKLLNGLYEPDEGIILFQGQNIFDISIDEVRANLSVVPQESFVFPDTIFNNISIAKPDASLEEVIESCKIANIHDFIISLDEGYDTVLNNVVVSLSNGQMQRINLARAFLRNSQIWLFDEPTSALDVNNRNIIMNYISNVNEEKTIVCILHEPDLITNFNIKVEIKDGQITNISWGPDKGCL